MQALPSSGEPLWVNQNPTESYMWQFLQLINKKYDKTLKTYDDLYNWSIACLPQFWEEVWAFTGVEASFVPRSSGACQRQNGCHINEKKPFKQVSVLFYCQVIYVNCARRLPGLTYLRTESSVNSTKIK